MVYVLYDKLGNWLIKQHSADDAELRIRLQRFSTRGEIPASIYNVA